MKPCAMFIVLFLYIVDMYISLTINFFLALYASVDIFEYVEYFRCLNIYRNIGDDVCRKK